MTDKARANRLKTTYGITAAQYDSMLKQQAGACYICHNEPKTRRLAVDHCHTSGFVRGLLCPSCNRAIAAFRDNRQHLARAALYLSNAEQMYYRLTPDEQDDWLLFRGRASGKLRRKRLAKRRVMPRLPQTE